MKKGLWVIGRMYLMSLGCLIMVFFLGGCSSVPKDIQLVNAASGAFDQMRYDQCIQECTKAIMVNPRSYFAYNLRGNCRQAKGEYGPAIEDFKKALQFYPGCQVARLNLQNSLGEYEREKRARQMQAATELGSTRSGSSTQSQTPGPDVLIYRVEVRPKRILPGSQFQLSFEYAVMDPSLKCSKLPASCAFKIFQGTKVLKYSRSFKLYSPNGIKMRRTIHLKASKDKGIYTAQVFLQYKKSRKAKNVQFIIE